jgi:hypothetical protein
MEPITTTTNPPTVTAAEIEPGRWYVYGRRSFKVESVEAATNYDGSPMIIVRGPEFAGGRFTLYADSIVRPSFRFA